MFRLFEIFLISLGKGCIAVNFPPGPAFAASHRFLDHCFHFHLSPGVFFFLISSLISALIHWLCVLSRSVASDSVTLSISFHAHQFSLSMEFSRQKYWSSLPFPSPGDLSDPGIEPMSPESPALAGRFFTSTSYGKPQWLFSSILFGLCVFVVFHKFFSLVVDF